MIAAFLGPREADVLAQAVEEGGAGIDLEVKCLPLTRRLTGIAPLIVSTAVSESVGAMGGAVCVRATIGTAVAATPTALSEERNERRLTRPVEDFFVCSECRRLFLAGHAVSTCS